MDKQDLLSYLDSYLAHDQFSMDSSANGLQVDTSKKDISTIGYAVDVTTYIIEKAAEKGVDMLLTHHGLFRGQEQVITGPHYERMKLLMQHDIAVYSSHLPLDAHAIVGNNYGLMAARQRIFAL